MVLVVSSGGVLVVTSGVVLVVSAEEDTGMTFGATRAKTDKNMKFIEIYTYKL